MGSEIFRVFKCGWYITIEWWKERRSDFSLFVSEIVEDEAKQGDPSESKKRIELLNRLEFLPTKPEAIDLAKALLERVLPQKAERDALHIAVAALGGIEYLLTWNFRHIANAEMRYDIIETCNKAGYECPILCSPGQLLGVKK